jgi:hypothetical protein
MQFVKRHFERVSRLDFLAASILGAVILAIFINSYWFGVKQTPDGREYLRAALSLLSGNGLHVDAAAGDPGAFLTVWPMGYPALIALISACLGINVMLASKVLSCLIMLALFLIVKRRYPDALLFLALIFATSGFRGIFYQSWSEQPFLLGMVWLAVSLYDVLASERPTAAAYGGVFLSCVMLFLMRYVGLALVGVTGLAGLWALAVALKRGQPKGAAVRGLGLMALAGGAALLAAVYLYRNYLEAGLAAGNRFPIQESRLRLLLELGRAGVAQAAGSWLPLSVLAFVWYRGQATIKDSRTVRMDRFKKGLPYWAFALTYLLGMAVMRFLFHFDPFNYRLLFPAMFMGLLGLAVMVAGGNAGLELRRLANSVPWRRILLASLLILLIPVSFQPAKNIVKRAIGRPIVTRTGYAEMADALREQHRDIPGGSLILFGNSDMLYIRPDLKVDEPGGKSEVAQPETMGTFLERNRAYKQIFLFNGAVPVENSIDWPRYDKSVYEFLNRHKGETNRFIRIR